MATQGERKETWWASHVARKLDYKDLQSFSGVLEKTIQTFTYLSIPVFENIVPAMNGKKKDYQLSRFASYLAVLNADSKKETVNQAKYSIARKTGLSIKTLQELDRVGLREELSDANKWLNSKAKKAGVTDFGAFMNAGYMGMYRMLNRQMLEYRKLSPQSNMLDQIGKIEISANLLRISMTEKAIESQNIKRQGPLEELHKQVGEHVRQSIVQSLRTYPENLPAEKDIEQVKRELNEIYKKLS